MTNEQGKKTAAAMALFESLHGEHFNEFRAVRVFGDNNWEIVTPRSQDAIKAACETHEPA